MEKEWTPELARAAEETHEGLALQSPDSDEETDEDLALQSSDSDEETDEDLDPQSSDSDEPPPKSKKPFPFLSLPIELRDIIYNIVFDSPMICATTPSSQGTDKCRIIELYRHCNGQKVTRRDDLHVMVHTQPNAYRTKTYVRAPLTPGLLVACRQVYAEAVPVLYGRNRFYVDSWLTLTTFLDSLRPDVQRFLREVHLTAQLDMHGLPDFCVGETQMFQRMADRVTLLRFFAYKQTNGRSPLEEAQILWRLASSWLTAVAKQAECEDWDGVEHVLKLLSSGMHSRRGEWDVGQRCWETFAGELRRLMQGSELARG